VVVLGVVEVVEERTSPELPPTEDVRDLSMVAEEEEQQREEEEEEEEEEEAYHGVKGVCISIIAALLESEG